MHAVTGAYPTPSLPKTRRDAPKAHMSQPHFLLLTFPLPGHMNPTLQFADRLSRTGAHITFFTTVYAHRSMIKADPSPSLSYATFSDGFDDGPGDATMVEVGVQFKKRGTDALAHLLRTLADGVCPVTCVIYTLLQSWAADVARELHIPRLLLWLQPAAVFFAYYHYFHDHHDLIVSCIEKGPSCSFNLPGLPTLAPRDLPSFILPDASSPFKDVISVFKEQFDEIDREEKARVLVNTFEEAEPQTVGAVVGSVKMVCVGPLIPPAFFDGREASNATDGGDAYKDSKNCMAWLDSQAKGSVVYVSFGSIIMLKEEQMVEMLNGLLDSGRPFLWVLRTEGQEGGEKDGETGFWEKARAAEKRGEGMVVAWCSQLAVLSHASVGCFVSHCGWNSTTESLAAGVPMVCLPQWSDQTTIAKLVGEVWKAGVRAESNQKGVFEGGEVKRCLDLVMGEEIRKNALRWRELAREAGAEGGLGDGNIRAFVEELKRSAAAAE